MLHAAEKNKAAAFEDLSFFVGQFPIQVPPGFIDCPVDKGNHMIGVMYDVHVGEDGFDGVHICGRHVHSNGSQGDPFAFELLQEGDQGGGIFAFMGMKDGAGFQIDDHGHIMVTFSGSKLIDGKVAHLVQLPLGETQGKMTFEDGFDQVPPDIEEKGDVFNRGDPAQVNHEAIEGSEPSPFSFGEVNGLLQSTATTATLLEMAMKNDELFSSSYGERMELSCKCPVHDQMNPAGMTMSAPPCLSLLADMVIDGTALKFGLLMMVVRQPQCVVKIACRRHGLSPFVIVGEQSRNVLPWRRFFYAGHRRRVSDEIFTSPFSTRLLVRTLPY